jgi:pimeloyl-ACP methyl ester carboxylesterase
MFETVLRQLGIVLPSVRGLAAYRHFCTPHLSTHRSADHDSLVERARFHLREATPRRLATSQGNLQAYIFEPQSETAAASALMVHGWTGEAAFMSAFADHLLRHNFRVVLFDLPAHGKSEGRMTSLIACAHAVREVAEALGPLPFVVGHSLGAMAALLAAEGGPPMPRPCPFAALVLVAMPNRFSEVTRRFGAEQGLSPAAQRVYEHRLERLAHRRIADFTGTNLIAGAGTPVMLLHARDDAEVPFADAQEIVAACPGAELQSFDGLGHRKILYAPPAVRAATAYLSRQRQALLSRRMSTSATVQQPITASSSAAPSRDRRSPSLP